MFRYLPIKENLRSDELGTYISYGIKAFDTASREIMFVHDVSLNEALVTELCRSCTLHQLHPIHLLDVIEDNI